MNKPISLKELPAHLNSGGDDIVVDMGMIVQKSNWPRRAAFASVFCLLLVGGFWVFNSTEEVTIVVNSNSGSDVISTVIKDNGGEVVEVENNTYRVKISRFKNISSFLDKLRSNKMVESASLGGG